MELASEGPRTSRRHPAGRAAEEHRRLTSGIAAADDDGLGAFAEARLELGRGVVDAGALELGQPVDGQPPVLHPAGDDHRLGPQALAAVERRAEAALLEPFELGDPARHGEAGAELHRLDLAAPDQVAAGDAGREPHIVLDPAGGSSLTANCDVFTDQGAQTFGTGIDRGRDARGAAADDQDVDLLVLAEFEIETEQPRDLLRRRVGHHGAAPEDH